MRSCTTVSPRRGSRRSRSPQRSARSSSRRSATSGSTAPHSSSARGGRAGETFAPKGDSTTIGRSPDCGIFLDDVTVSRKHATLVQRDGRWLIEDAGSLNGTFVNRKRVESAALEDSDEIQIGKYRLTFLTR